jgi:hypothetical protein
MNIAIDVPGLTNGLIIGLRHSSATVDAQKLSHTAPLRCASPISHRSALQSVAGSSQLQWPQGRPPLPTRHPLLSNHLRCLPLPSLDSTPCIIARKNPVTRPPAAGVKQPRKNSTRSSTTEAAASTGSNATLQAPSFALASSHSAPLLCAREREHLTGPTWPVTLCPRFVLTAGWPVMASGLTLSHRTPSSSSVRARPIIQSLDSVGAP